LHRLGVDRSRCDAPQNTSIPARSSSPPRDRSSMTDRPRRARGQPLPPCPPPGVPMSAALLAAVLSDPEDDTGRLVLADYLEVNGEPELGRFIRAASLSPRPPALGFGTAAVPPSRVGLTELLAGGRQPVQRGGVVRVEGDSLAELPGRLGRFSAKEFVPSLGRQSVDRVEVEQELLLDHGLVIDELQGAAKLPMDRRGYAS